MNSFKIGDTEFGIGNIQFAIEDNLLSLEITGSEDVFDELTENDDAEWGWALYPPKIFFRDVPYVDKDIVVDEDSLDQYDIALYMMEHNDFTGTIKVSAYNIDICGQVDINGDILSVAISVDRKGF